MAHYNNTEKTASLIPNSVLFNRRPAVQSATARCPLSGKDAPVIDYKNIALLSLYISEKGRILPSRLTNICASKQRALKKAIKRARAIALLPYSAS